MAITSWRGWIVAILCFVTLLAALGQPPPREFGDEDDPNLPPFKSTTARGVLPYVTANTPLAWTPVPTGKGELLLHAPPYMQGIAVGGQTLIPTELGLLRKDNAQTVTLVPRLFGRPVFIVGEAEGKVWVQDNAGHLYGLNPKTLAIEAEVNGLAGACIGVLPDVIWCLDRYVTRDADRPFPYGTKELIEYDRAGAERRRVNLAEDAPADFIVQWANIDGTQIWLATSNGDVSCIHRVDIKTGDMRTVKADRVQLPIFTLNGRLLWCDRMRETHAEVYQLDKATLTVTSLGKIPAKYTGYQHEDEARMVVTEEYIWCEGAVFSTKDCRRVRAKAAGTPPELPKRRAYDEEEYDDEGLPYSTGYTFLGADAQRAWLGSERLLCEVQNDGTLITRELTPLQITMPVPITTQAGAVVFRRRDERNRLYRVQSDTDTVNIAAPNDAFVMGASSETRLWFTSGRRLVTCGPEMQLRKILNPTPQELDLHQALAVGDELYLYGAEQRIWRINGATGALLNLESWEAQVPKAERQKLRLLASASLANGRLLFIFSPQGRRQRYEDEEGMPVVNGPFTVYSYTPATDQWQRQEANADIPGVRHVVKTAQGVIALAADGKTLLRAGETGWQPLGTLPSAFSTTVLGGTDRYLYLQSPIGLYRMRWDELAPVAATPAHGG